MVNKKGVDNEKLLDAYCRDPDIPGNVVHYAGFTPPSRKKCGNRSPEAPTKENHCFCATLETQARKYLGYRALVDLQNALHYSQRTVSDWVPKKDSANFESDAFL